MGVINFGLINARIQARVVRRVVTTRISRKIATRRPAATAAAAAASATAAAAAADKNPIAPVFASRKGQSRSSWCPALPPLPPAAAPSRCLPPPPPSRVPSNPRAISPRSNRQLEQLRPTSPERGRPWKIRGWDSRARTLRNERPESDEEGRRLKGIVAPCKGVKGRGGQGWEQDDGDRVEGEKGGWSGSAAGQINAKANKSATLTCRSPQVSVYFIR